MAQHDSEFGALLDLIERECPNLSSILDIGVWQGGTLARFARRFPNAKVVGIDPAPQIERWPPEDWGTFLTGYSQHKDVRASALALAPGGSYDVIHIDGDHGLEAVKSDWDWAKTNARKLVIFHDISCRNNIDIGVYDLWDTLVLSGIYRTETIQHADGNYGYGIVYL